MAILIVDDEASTRSALRDLLSQIGHKTILEAKNGEEALKTAEAEKSRIRLIVADWEMPYMDGITLLERISGLPELDLAPFLLITSDLPKSKLAELQAKTDRLDAFLIKPFRFSALSQAMSAAQAHRAAVKREIVALCPQGALPPALKSALAQLTGLWNEPLMVRTQAELERAVSDHGRRLGALVIDPASVPPAETRRLADWLGGFARTPAGTSTLIVYTSRDPLVIHPFRTLGQAFLAADADWAGFWKQARARASAALDLELLSQELKSALQKKSPVDARKTCESILALDPASPEAHATLGDLLTEQGKRDEAMAHYWAALTANPCQPKPYIRLLEAAQGNKSAVGKAAAEAAAHCSQNIDVLMSAARAWQGAGEAAQARTLAERCLAINPQHAGARALLVAIQGA